MSSYPAKLGALLAAGALIATAAIPAYASGGSAVTPNHQTLAVQTVSFDTAIAVVTPSRDG